MLRWILDVWTAYAHRAGTYQSAVLLTVVYAVILGPAASVGRWSGTRLLDLRRDRASTWVVRPTAVESLDALRRQF